MNKFLKKILLICAVLLFSFGCIGEAKSKNLVDVAVIYTQSQYNEISDMKDLVRMPRLGEGRDMIVIIARSAPLEISLFLVELDEHGIPQLPTMVDSWQAAANQPFLLNADFGETIPKVALRIKEIPGDKYLTWFPQFSGKDGSLVLGEGMKLFTIKGKSDCKSG